jgi:hypothetical protein
VTLLFEAPVTSYSSIKANKIINKKVKNYISNVVLKTKSNNMETKLKETA